MLTTQQDKAVQCREVSVLLSSGAGCGKTHVLTARYLSHLREDGLDVGQIVAITFTERAARQMRDRIRQAVLSEVQAAPSDEVAERWSRHWRDLESAPISTIHGFCATLLRQHAVQAGLDPRFEILEEVLSVNIAGEALTDCFRHLLLADTPVGEDLRRLVLLYGWKPVVDGIKALVAAADIPAWSQWLQQAPEAVASEWQRFAREILLPAYLRFVILGAPKVAFCLNLLRRIRPLPGTKMAEQVLDLE
jgi:ATP-dependent helicase/nuclease subunit A